jgi:ArsR family transcriptional regulator, arsenate/arsenite/antimonite-responsive transcriptional repressor / arsenate reductase (thioredoxin)
MPEITPLPEPPEIFTQFGNPIRWQIVSALVHSDRRAQELVEFTGQPQNLVSYHLSALRQSGLVTTHRSSADGREVYYALDLEKTRQLYQDAGKLIHPALGEPGTPLPRTTPPAQKVRVLFLCTHNSARSQIAEAILRSRGGEKILAFSAGTEPSRIHPLALKALDEYHIDYAGQTSKSMEVFFGQTFDYIITVCDRARESCPIFPGDPEQIHWSFADPAAVEGSEKERYKAFRDTTIQMITRINFLLLMLKRTHGLDNI